MVAIINDAARAYAGVIPEDRYGRPYMPLEELCGEIDAGVRFWGLFEDAAEEPATGERVRPELAGLMGIQDVDDVTLIRHAYVRPDRQRAGVGGRLLACLIEMAADARPPRPLLVGTWAAAWWAVAFYERHGFELVTPEEKDRLLRRYWTIPERQVETSVVLLYVGAAGP
jgi:GNAT superfamily N-acetyltransferase